MPVLVPGAEALRSAQQCLQEILHRVLSLDKEALRPLPTPTAVHSESERTQLKANRSSWCRNRPGFHKHEEASSTCAEGSAQPGLPRQHSPTELPFRQHWCISSTPDRETSTRAEEI